MQQINEEIVKKILSLLNHGLTKGLGKPKPGEMCIEAAICYAFGEPHNDKPSCVALTLAQCKILINDANWSSNKARADGLKRLAIAQLGTKNTIDEKLFVEKLALMTVNTILPSLLRKANLEKNAIECENVKILKTAAYVAYAAARAADINIADKILSDYCEKIVKILIEMKTPGSNFLYLVK